MAGILRFQSWVDWVCHFQVRSNPGCLVWSVKAIILIQISIRAFLEVRTDWFHITLDQIQVSSRIRCMDLVESDVHLLFYIMRFNFERVRFISKSATNYLVSD